MGRFVIIVNGLKPLFIITKHSILDIAAALDPPLVITETQTQMRKNSSDFSKNFMNRFFTEHLRTVASVS